MPNKNQTPISPQLQNKLRQYTADNTLLSVLVWVSDGVKEKTIAKKLHSLGIVPREEQLDTGFFSVEATPSQIRKLSKVSWVEVIVEDQPVTLI